MIAILFIENFSAQISRKIYSGWLGDYNNSYKGNVLNSQMPKIKKGYKAINYIGSNFKNVKF